MPYGPYRPYEYRLVSSQKAPYSEYEGRVGGRKSRLCNEEAGNCESVTEWSKMPYGPYHHIPNEYRLAHMFKAPYSQYEGSVGSRSRLCNDKENNCEPVTEWSNMPYGPYRSKIYDHDFALAQD